MFNIIARRTLKDCIRRHSEAKTSLEKWYTEIIGENFKNFNELKEKFPSASIVGDDRVVFNVLGNKYRLIVRLVFEFKVIQIKWFGAHSEYDKINAETIQFKR